jgi:hypothetical protein
MNVRSPIAFAMVSSAVALVCAVPASADATDDAFIAALGNHNIAVNDSNRAAWLAEAQMVCDGLDKHYNTTQLAMKLVGDTDLSVKQSSFFVGAAVAAYCPQYRSHSSS